MLSRERRLTKIQHQAWVSSVSICKRRGQQPERLRQEAGKIQRIVISGECFSKERGQSSLEKYLAVTGAFCDGGRFQPWRYYGGVRSTVGL